MLYGGGGSRITQRSGALSPFPRPCFIAPWTSRAEPAAGEAAEPKASDGTNTCREGTGGGENSAVELAASSDSGTKGGTDGVVHTEA